MFYSTQTPPAGFNRGHYSNPEVDRLLDLAGAATGEAERKKYYGDVQKIVAEDAPYISIWNRTNKESADKLAMPLASGLIAGEAVMAIVIPVLIALKLVAP